MVEIAEPDRMADLVEFAKLEVSSGDLEPWAEFLKALRKHFEWDNETTLWQVYLYNEFDSFSSAWGVFSNWKHPLEWEASEHKDMARQFPHMQERRNLHGGRGLVRMQSYVDLICKHDKSAVVNNGGVQENWFRKVMSKNLTPESNFLQLMDLTQQVWGVGRLAAFEWTEFLGKVMEWPVHAPDAQLWLSSGPRKSLQRLYGNPEPSQKELDTYAHHCRQHLADHGVNLQWEDFETVICDFNVMRGGRYYPGRHLAALRGEIEEIPSSLDRSVLLDVFKDVIPAPWNEIEPGIDKTMMPKYKDTGTIHLPVTV